MPKYPHVHGQILFSAAQVHRNVNSIQENLATYASPGVRPRISRQEINKEIDNLHAQIASCEVPDTHYTNPTVEFVVNHARSVLAKAQSDFPEMFSVRASLAEVPGYVDFFLSNDTREHGNRMDGFEIADVREKFLDKLCVVHMEAHTAGPIGEDNIRNFSEAAQYLQDEQEYFKSDINGRKASAREVIAREGVKPEDAFQAQETIKGLNKTYARVEQFAAALAKATSVVQMRISNPQSGITMTNIGSMAPETTNSNMTPQESLDHSLKELRRLWIESGTRPLTGDEMGMVEFHARSINEDLRILAPSLTAERHQDYTEQLNSFYSWIKTPNQG